MRTETTADLGDLVIVLLAGTLAGLRDRLDDDGFAPAARLVAELTERCDSYLEEVSR
jgi:hypothetical protein